MHILLVDPPAKCLRSDPTTTCRARTVCTLDGYDGGCGGVPGRDAKAEDSLQGR